MKSLYNFVNILRVHCMRLSTLVTAGIKVFSLNYMTSICALFVVYSTSSQNFSSNHVYCSINSVVALIVQIISVLHLCLINDILRISHTKKSIGLMSGERGTIQLDHPYSYKNAYKMFMFIKCLITRMDCCI